LNTLVAQNYNGDCHTLSFDTIPNEIIEEGLQVGEQFSDSLGIIFRIEKESDSLPRIAKVGSPGTAFNSSYGWDTPAPDQSIGEYFLTDDGTLAGLIAPPLVIQFTNPIDSACGVVLDVDFNEHFTIFLMNSIKQKMDSIFIQHGDENTGDGIATRWSFKRDTADVFYIRLVGERTAAGYFGLGFDNFCFCRPQQDTLNATKYLVKENSDRLKQNYPNPFDKNTLIEYSVLSTSKIEIKIYNNLGKEVTTLVEKVKPAGNHSVNFDASGLENGIYYYRLQAGNVVQTRKMIVSQRD
jgi:hypothetical protein